ncbi:MAG: hypothetical protein AAFR98_11330 [Pseudomonadota bacterium]
MRLPLNIVIGAAVLVAQSLLSIFFLSIEFTGGPYYNALGQFFLVGGVYDGPFVLLTSIGLVFAALSIYYVVRGEELGRSLFLLWTSFVLVAGVVVAQDPLLVLADTTMRIMVLFLWFTPEASRYFFEKGAAYGAVA